MDNKIYLKPQNPAQKKILEFPRLSKTFLTSLILNTLLVFVLFSNRQILIPNWKSVIHAWSRPDQTEATQTPTVIYATPKPTETPSASVSATPKSEAEDCDGDYVITKSAKGAKGVCYPKAK